MKINKTRTGLVVIDLQKGIAGRETKPHSSETVCRNTVLLADAFRKNNMPVFLVHVVSKDIERLHPETDEKMAFPSKMPEDWADFVPQLGPKENDIIIVKKQTLFMLKPVLHKHSKLIISVANDLFSV